MGLGVLNYTRLDHVPGTILLDDLSIDVDGSGILNLKKGKGRNSHIILAPQPSDDPNDPLNWPLWKRDLNMSIIFIGALLFACVMTPMISAGTAVIAVNLGVPIAKVSQLSGYQLLVAAGLGPFVSAFARVYGKRPQFLLASIFGIVGTIICETSGSSYNQLLAGRIVQGAAIAAYESVSFTVVGDLYFVHERGVRLSIINMVFTSVTGLASIIGGPITSNLGWRWMFHIFLIFAVIQLVLLILFAPEPTYNRKAIYDIDTNADPNLEVLVEREKHEIQTSDADKGSSTNIARVSSTGVSRPVRISFVQQLSIFNGRFSDENLLKLILAPFAICLNPVILWAIVCQGTGVMWYVGFAYIIAQLFFPPPYLLSAAQVGYLYVGPFVLGLLTCLLLAVISDPIMKALTRRNKGIYEPEFRLALFPIGVVISAVGYFGFGNFYANQIGGYSLASAMYALVACSLTFQMVSVNTYVLDAYRSLSTEIFIASNTYKNFFFYGLSLFVNDWVAKSGPGPMSDVAGATVVGTCVLGMLVYIFGKRIRGGWFRIGLMKKLRLITEDNQHR